MTTPNEIPAKPTLEYVAELLGATAIRPYEYDDRFVIVERKDAAAVMLKRDEFLPTPATRERP